MGALPTVRIRLANGESARINESDYNPDVHTLYTENTKAAADRQPAENAISEPSTSLPAEEAAPVPSASSAPFSFKRKPGRPPKARE